MTTLACEIKKCPTCGETKPSSEYTTLGAGYRSADGNQRYKSECKACATKRARVYRRRLIGWTPEQYDQVFLDQGGVCAICGGTDENRALAADHDHATGAVRGLLCRRCNQSMGKFDDDLVLLRKVVAYLESHQ